MSTVNRAKAKAISEPTIQIKSATPSVILFRFLIKTNGQNQLMEVNLDFFNENEIKNRKRMTEGSALSFDLS